MTKPDLEAAIAASDERLAELRGTLAGRATQLPLRFWRQQAHLTAPAQRDVAAKALTAGTAPMARILARFGVAPSLLAERLGVAPAAVQALLAEPRSAPVVMIDAEDALAPTESAARQGRVDAIDVLSTPADRERTPSLRFYRPPGLALGTTTREVFSVLWGLVDRHGAEALPLDGIVIPKVDHPEEVDFIHDLLGDAERQLGIEIGSIRTAYLVESAACVDHLDEIAIRASDRLCGLIFGLADYSADVGLPVIANDHPLTHWARARLINTAAAVGVPAIDGMSLAYPVSDPTLDAASDRERFLDRMTLVYDDAVRAHELGMQGKWVGHPAQLFAVLLAFDAAFRPETLEREAAKLAAYAGSVDAGDGVTMIDGVMSDRATDRHARVLLRQAVAMGRFEARRAHELGVIDSTELATTEQRESTDGG
jgi:citrate lyase beta subunit